MPDYRFPGFPDGLNNVARDDQVPSTAMTKALNVDLLPTGKPARRKGYQRVVAGTEMHSAYAAENFFLAVDQGQLKLWVDFDVSPLVLASNLNSSVSYVTLNDMVVWGCESNLGAVDMQGQLVIFGIEAPAGQPDLAPINVGGLFEGTYQVAVTYVTASGVESGTGKAVVVEVEEGGGIQLSNIPQPADANVTGIVVYASQANGETLYARATIPANATSFELGYLSQRRQLATQFTNRIPASSMLALYNGRLYAAKNEVTYYSEPMKFWSKHDTEGYFFEPSNINMLLAGEQGVFVGCAEGVFFYRGDEPDKFVRNYVSHPAIPGAGISVDGAFLDPRIAGQQVALWWTVEGVLVAGMPDGSVEAIREAEFRIPDAELGAMAPLTREGIKQVVSVMKNPGTESSMAFGDNMDIQVHRHGV